MVYRLLALLVVLGALGCGDEPDVSVPEGSEMPAETPVEAPPERLTGPGTSPLGEEPGVPGSDRPEDGWLLEEGKLCYAYRRYVVRVEPRAAAAGEDVFVYRRAEGGTRAQCDGRFEAAFTATDDARASRFGGVVGDLLLLDEGTDEGPVLRVVDLASGAAVHESAYEEPLAVDSGAVVYGMAPEVARSMDELAALGVECPEAMAWLGEGLGVGLSPRVRYDLAARAATPTGEVLCIPVE